MPIRIGCCDFGTYARQAEEFANHDGKTEWSRQNWNRARFVPVLTIVLCTGLRSPWKTGRSLSGCLDYCYPEMEKLFCQWRIQVIESGELADEVIEKITSDY